MDRTGLFLYNFSFASFLFMPFLLSIQHVPFCAASQYGFKCFSVWLFCSNVRFCFLLIVVKVLCLALIERPFLCAQVSKLLQVALPALINAIKPSFKGSYSGGLALRSEYRYASIPPEESNREPIINISLLSQIKQRTSST